jgi:AraC-like DNA-binding protein
MGLIIHKVLYEKLQRHPAWRDFEEAFHTLTGSEVRLVEERHMDCGGELAVRVELHGVYVGTLAVTGAAPQPGQENAWRYLLEVAAERFAALLAASNIHDREPIPRAILRTCRWIRTRALAQEVPLSEAAAHCRLSPSHLSRLFHKSTGMTYQAYVTRFRLENACKLLLNSRRPVTEVAFDSGFQSISQFHRSFKAIYGERPLEFRRKAAAG